MTAAPAAASGRSKAPVPPARGRARPRVRTPTVIQMEAVECGAASLSIVLGYHGRFEPLETLRTACGVSRDGSKASNVVKAARTYGLDAGGFRKELEELYDLEPPFVVFWNFNHFLVVEGFVIDRVYLNDPGTGPRVVTLEEFDAAFTGVVLTFTPNERFVRGGEPPSLARALAPRLRGARVALTYLVLVGLAMVVPGLVIPTFSTLFVDDILIAGSHRWLAPLLVALAATAALRGAFAFLQRRYLVRLETKLALALSSRFLWHALRLPTGFFAARSAGDLVTRAVSGDRIAQLLSGDLARNALNVLVVAFYAALMLTYDARLAAVSLVLAGLNVLALRSVLRRRAVAQQKLSQDRGRLAAVAMGGLQIIETLKATGGESDYFARFAGFQAKVANAERELEVGDQILNAVPPLLTALNTALILGLGALEVMSGEMTLGMLVAFQSLTASFIAPVNEMVALSAKMQELRGELDRLDDVHRQPVDPLLLTTTTITDSTTTTRTAEPFAGGGGASSSFAAGSRLRGHLALRKVSFGYSPLEPPLIDGLDLELTPGMRVALVGGSGSGKSTVARLVAGLVQPWRGEILFDGLPRSAIPRDVLTDSLAMVDQEICLFEGSVRENLSLWDTTMPERALRDAAVDGVIHDELTARPGGYEGRVEESGRNFSGGQRQRLEIARALARRPSILVLDEATSALDPVTELAVDRAVRRRGCTCLIVAHRLSTVRDCDEIIVLDRGKVLERGTHESLLARGGAYAALMESA